MRTKLNPLVLLLGVCILGWGVGAAWSAPIRYKQTMTKILDETQFRGWPEGLENNSRGFDMLANSADGSRIGFQVKVRDGDTTYVRTYAANADGSEVMNLTDVMPEIVNPGTATFLKLDPKGDYLFFRAPTYGTVTNIYYVNLATQACNYAVVPKFGEDYALLNYDARKPYSLTAIGDDISLYFKHNAGWDDVTKRNNLGIYSATLGGLAAKVMDIDQLPATTWDINFLRFLGSAAQANQILCTWNQDYGSPSATAMWRTAGPIRVPDETHKYVFPDQDQYAHMVSADGTKSLYCSLDTGPRQLYRVDLFSRAKTLINETYDLNGYFAPALSPSGDYAFFSTLGHKNTRHNLATGEERDTWAYWFTESSWVGTDYLVSDITADDRYYFMGSKPEGDIARIHCVDLAPTDFTQTPNVTAINFSAPRLVNDGTTKITVTAAVSDTQGLGTIDRVRLQCLVDGLEKPAWLVGDPVYYSAVMYDDGVNGGDLVAGDGIYTNNTLRTNPSSNFYTRYPLPHDIGIRVIARDQDRNYVLADTVLIVATTAFGYTPAPSMLLLGD